MQSTMSVINTNPEQTAVIFSQILAFLEANVSPKQIQLEMV